MKWIPTLVRNADAAMADELDRELSAFKPEPDKRSTLEKARDTTGSLIAKMTDRRASLENQIAQLSDELAQTNTIIEGATAMAQVLDGGK